MMFNTDNLFRIEINLKLLQMIRLMKKNKKKTTTKEWHVCSAKTRVRLAILLDLSWGGSIVFYKVNKQV